MNLKNSTNFFYFFCFCIFHSQGVKGAYFENSASMSKGHLLIDPNLPISSQFHTYSSIAPSSKSFGLSLNRQNSRRNNNLTNHLELGNNSLSLNLGLSLSKQDKSIHSSFPINNNNRRNYPFKNEIGSNGQSRSSESSTSASEKDSAAFNRHRELHKTLEKNRRAHLRNCFEQLKKELPQSEYRDRKSSHINIIHCALRYIQCLKRDESEKENEIKQLKKARQRYLKSIIQLKSDLDYDKNHLTIDQILREASEKIAGNRIIIHGLKSQCVEDINEGNVIIEFEVNQDYDDETTTTASGESKLIE